MNSSNNSPDIDPANNESLAGTIRFAFNKLLQSVNGMLPAKVIKYDRATNRVQVQLLIVLVTTDGYQVPRPQIASLPVLVAGGGGFMLSFPLNPGDLGWVLANDRDISLFLQTYTAQPPNTSRIMSFSDGLFIPDVMTNYTIETEDEGNAVLSSIDGTVRIVLWPDQVKITAPTTIINGDLTVTGSLSVTGAAETLGGLSVSGGGHYALSVTGFELITGALGVQGFINATGLITPVTLVPPP